MEAIPACKKLLDGSFWKSNDEKDVNYLFLVARKVISMVHFRKLVVQSGARMGLVDSIV
jgi:hypothetical protein